MRKYRPAESVPGFGVSIDSGPGNPGTRGFTLIELLTVVAIVGILAAIGYPSYQWALERSRVTEARTNLTSLALLLEQHRSVYGCYNKRTGTPPVCPSSSTAVTYAYKENDAGAATTDAITSWLNFNPRAATDVDAAKGIRYEYSISATDNIGVTPPVHTYTVTAAPVTSRGARAGNLTLNQAGAKTGWN